MATYNPRNRQVRWSFHKRRFYLVLRPGTSDEAGQAARRHIEHLIHCHKTNLPPHASTLEWVKTLEDHQCEKLADSGLVARRQETECRWIEGFAAWILEQKRETGVQTTSLQAYGQPAENLKTFFAGRLIGSITEVDVWRFRKWLSAHGNRRTGGELAITTVRKRLKTCREWFELAFDLRWIERNPFRIFKDLDQKNEGERQFYVEPDVIHRCIEETPSTEWKLLLSLWRFAGLRATEPLYLRWEDIDFAERKMVATSCKHGGPRIIPIWPEVFPHLQDQFEQAPDGAKWVIHDEATRGVFDTDKSSRSTSTRLYNRLSRQLKRMKVWPWEKLIQQLRASGETQRVVVEGWPAHTIAKWWDHSERVQRKHYLQIPDEMYARASGGSGKFLESAADLPTNVPTSDHQPKQIRQK